MKKKSLALVLALALMVVGAVGGTLAWLTAQTDAVTNTFTTSNITVKLAETTGTEYKMVPGYELEKDPKAWVVSGSEGCYLFVKLDWANNTYASGEKTKNYLDWKIADGWEKVDGTPDVYSRKVTSEHMSTDEGKNNAFPVLKDNKVTVSGDITKAQMNDFTENNLPKLTITAYASQLYKSAGVEFTAKEAWDNINK